METPVDDFPRRLVRAIAVLEHATWTALDEGWMEPQRRRAHGIAVAIADACRASGLDETWALARAIASLLALPLGEVLSLEDALRDKFAELFGLLREKARALSA